MNRMVRKALRKSRQGLYGRLAAGKETLIANNATVSNRGW